MTNLNYSTNYIRIYLWKFFSILTGFLSLLIAVPNLSNNPELYGIYAFCISFTLYLTYADIGFLASGQKYAAEEFARGNRKKEVEIFGFTAFILLILILPFSMLMIYFSIHPQIVINNLTVEGQNIASNIFLILGVLSPFQIILQRLAQSILIIRIKDFVSLRIDIIFNLIRTLSVFFFFADGKYLVVEFFLFINVLGIISALLAILMIRKTEKYDFVALIKAVKFTHEYFQLTKKLAFSSLFLTIGWLIYYELDLIFIGKLFGPHEVAIYSIGFTFLGFLRTLWNVIFSPFSQRFNHFAGTNSIDEMKKMASRIMDYTFPICIVVTIILLLFSKQFVLFWVGPLYIDSVVILQILVIGTAFGFVTQPAGYYFTAKTKYSYIYLMATILPLIFLIALALTVPVFGIKAFAVSKTIAMVIASIISLIGISELVNPFQILRKWAMAISLFILFSFIIIPKISLFFFPSTEKNTFQLILMTFMVGGLIIFASGLLFVSQKRFRIGMKGLINRLFY